MHAGWRESLHSETLHSKIKVRCPQCFQAFRVNAAEIDQARPRFACTKCQSHFWLPFPEALKQKELIGFPISWIQSPTASFEEKTPIVGVARPVFDCPSCSFQNALNASECRKCGVIFEKVLARNQDQDEGVRSTQNLRQLWERIISDFDNDSLHESFLLECQKAGCLSYASRRYTKLEKAVGRDEKIVLMKGKLHALLEPKVVTPKAAAVAASSPRLPRPAKVLRWFRLSHVALFFAALFIVVGFFVPDGRNLIGVGAAMGFLVLAAMLS